jgi:hypothetical protein
MDKFGKSLLKTFQSPFFHHISRTERSLRRVGKEDAAMVSHANSIRVYCQESVWVHPAILFPPHLA